MKRNPLVALTAIFVSVIFTIALIATCASMHIEKRQDALVAEQRATESQKVDEATNEEETTEEPVNWFESFEVIDEATLKEITEKSKIKTAIYNQGNEAIYITMTNGDTYKIPDASSELKAFIRLDGIDLQIMNIPQIDGGSNEATTGDWMTYALAFAVIGAIFFGCRAAKKKANSKEFMEQYYPKNTKSNTKQGQGSKSDDNNNSDIPEVRFSDVEGIEDLKSDMMRLVDCLKNPEKYSTIGARIPKGVILYGPPGTGKTLIAKAIAGEAGVPFFSVVGSDFVEKYVGVGASRIRELYKKARKASPCIVFIDEVDAVASQRGRDDNTEKDQTINALLAELDGFKPSDSIITICATNRLDMLDSAFKRAGRFDLKLAVGLPDKQSRINILKIHGKNKKLSDEINLEQIAIKTQGFSGAELEALLNESALIAVGKNKTEIDYEDIDDAYFKIVMQGNKKKRDKITDINRVVAWHEAGHTLATKLLTDDSVPSVTIVGSASGAGGVTFRTPKEEQMLHSRSYLENLVQVMYAGRAAEEIYFGNTDDITTGASQDIKQATQIIKEYLSLYGMGDKGMLDLTQFSNNFNMVLSEATALSKKLYGAVLDVLKANKEKLKNLATALLEKETLEEEEIDTIINPALALNISKPECEVINKLGT